MCRSTIYQEGIRSMTRITTLLLACFLFFAFNETVTARPLIGFTGIAGSSPRTTTLSGLLEEHLIRITESTAIFSTINPSLLKSELTKFNCIDEKCILPFASRAGISLIVKGAFEDRGDSVMLRLFAYNTDVPGYGKIIYSHCIRIPMRQKYSLREFSYICEEHAGRFLSGVIKNFKSPVYFKKQALSGEKEELAGLHGKHTLFRFDGPDCGGGIRMFSAVGTVLVDKGAVKKNISGRPVRDGDFILRAYSKEADFLQEFYPGRKKEIIFERSTLSDTLWVALFTAPASAVMPLTVPALGHYVNSDWNGLLLWGVNATPYLYLEADGFLDRPAERRGENKDIPRSVTARNIFAWYMLCAGGASLFVDGFAHQYCVDAAEYAEVHPLMGNPLTAGYLSLICGGGGHFYRGYRLWGYFYFHLNNILLYHYIII